MGKKMRLPNGYGSVYKLSGNRRKPYAVAITTGIDEKGKYLRKIIGYAESRTEGLDILADFRKTPYDVDFKNLTFGEIWNNSVLKKLEQQVSDNKMSESNLTCLTLAFKNHCKLLYDDKILELRTKKMQYVIDMADLGYTGKGYIKTVCKKVFDSAMVEYELPIVNNPAEKLNIGERPKTSKHIPFTDEELYMLFKNDSNDIIKTILIMCYTGERPNELFITDISNIYLDDEYMITGSKTEAGKDRPIPIHPKIKKYIEYFMNRDVQFPFKTIFDSFNYQKYTREFRKLMQDFGWKHTPYDGRHTLTTKLKKAGVNEYIIKRIVGHSITDITERVYTHRDISELISAIKKID